MHRVQYTDRNGEKRQSSRFYATVRLPDGKTWHASLWNDRDKSKKAEALVRKVTGARRDGEHDREAEDALFELVKGTERLLSALAKHGLLNPSRARAAARTVEDLLDVHWRQELLSEGATGRHAEQQAQRARTLLLTKCAFFHPRDIEVDEVRTAVRELEEEGLTTFTRHGYIAAAKQFTRWLEAEEYVSVDPLRRLKKPRLQGAKTREDRVLTVEELKALVRETRRLGRRRQWLRGEVRALLYLVAAQTGARFGELAALRVRSLHLDGPKPTLVLEEATTKNRKGAVLPLEVRTAARLGELVRDKHPAATVFGVRSGYRQSEILRADCEAAGIATDPKATGKVTTYHSLRRVVGTRLAKSSASNLQITRAMRHSSVSVTNQFYVDAGVMQDEELVRDVLEPLDDEGDDAVGEAKSS